MSTARRKRRSGGRQGKRPTGRVCVSTASSVLDVGPMIRHAQIQPSGASNVERTQRLSEAVSVLRRRRSVDDADMLLEECLALLDTVAENSPFTRVTPARVA